MIIYLSVISFNWLKTNKFMKSIIKRNYKANKKIYENKIKYIRIQLQPKI